MKKEITCIECPKGCKLSVYKDADGQYQVEGNLCVRGVKYAHDELIDPRRILTSVVKAQGLEEQMVPVRTSEAIPKDKLLDAMEEIKKIRLSRSVKCGDHIVKNFLDMENVNLIATRSVGYYE